MFCSLKCFLVMSISFFFFIYSPVFLTILYYVETFWFFIEHTTIVLHLLMVYIYTLFLLYYFKK